MRQPSSVICGSIGNGMFVSHHTSIEMDFVPVRSCQAPTREYAIQMRKSIWFRSFPDRKSCNGVANASRSDLCRGQTYIDSRPLIIQSVRKGSCGGYEFHRFQWAVSMGWVWRPRPCSRMDRGSAVAPIGVEMTSMLVLNISGYPDTAFHTLPRPNKPLFWTGISDVSTYSDHVPAAPPWCTPSCTG